MNAPKIAKTARRAFEAEDYDVIWPEHPELPNGKQFDTGMVIPTWNRPAVLERSLASLRASELNDLVIVIADDASNLKETLAMINEFNIPDVPVIRMVRKKKMGTGVGFNLRNGWELLLERLECRHLAVLDSDTLLKKDWLHRLRALYRQLKQGHPRLVLSGFNTPKHPILQRSNGYCVKKSLGGLNMFFDSQLYTELLHTSTYDEHWDWYLVRLCQAQAIPLFAIRPSVIQHIGHHGVWSRGLRGHNWAPDFFLPEPLATVVGRLLQTPHKD